jgi:hypothetical protein
MVHTTAVSAGERCEATARNANAPVANVKQTTHHESERYNPSVPAMAAMETATLPKLGTRADISILASRRYERRPYTIRRRRSEEKRERYEHRKWQGRGEQVYVA